MADRERCLVDEGRREVKAAAAPFARAKLVVTAAHTSPYPRARETAEIFLAAVGARVALVEDDRLVPEADGKATAAWVSELAAAEATGRATPLHLFVAHEPILSHLISRLTGRRRRALEKAELVLLGWDGAAWHERELPGA